MKAILKKNREKVGRDLNLSIYPNPVTDHLTLTFDELIENGRVELYDLSGRIVHSSNIQKGESHKMAVNDISSGLYIVKVVYQDTVIDKIIYID